MHPYLLEPSEEPPEFLKAVQAGLQRPRIGRAEMSWIGFIVGPAPIIKIRVGEAFDDAFPQDGDPSQAINSDPRHPAGGAPSAAPPRPWPPRTRLSAQIMAAGIACSSRHMRAASWIQGKAVHQTGRYSPNVVKACAVAIPLFVR